jgi:DNA polymerase I
MKRLVLIDGKSVFYRGYYAMSGLSLRDGTPTGGVYGFASLALEIIRRLEPDYVAVAWDKQKTNIRKRLEIYPQYKAGRKPAPDDFYAQIPILHDLLKAFGWPLYECDDYEADDIMGTLSKQANEQGVETILISSDLDMLQIVDHDTKLYALKKGLSNIEEFDVAHFEEKYGIRLDQFLDLKALKGDSSDNIPGVPGIGEKTALDLLQKYDNLDNIFAHSGDERPSIAKKLNEGKDLAYLSKRLGEIYFDAPVTFDAKLSAIGNVDHTAVLSELKKLEFNSLIRKLPKTMTSASRDDQTSLFSTTIEPSIAPLAEVDMVDADFSTGELFITTSVNTEQIWCSTDGKTAFNISPREVKNLPKISRLIAHDVKGLLHTLDLHNVTIGYESVYDISQAAFLLSPLRRDFTLSSISGGDLDEANQAWVLAVMTQVYNQQKTEFTKLPSIRKVADQFDFPLIPILFAMEKRGVKIDTDFLAKMGTDLQAELTNVEKKIYDTVGDSFNIHSPVQLSKVLFETLNLPTTGIKKTTRGYSTGQSELDKLRGQHPIIELVEQTRELSKLKSTYVDALPKLADDNSHVHTTFTQNVTSTGRLSSVNPNLQNIPIRSDLGKKVRNGFVADEGCSLVSADYSQFELRLAAILANDRPLIDSFNDGIDIHTKTASDVYGIPLDAVTKDQRRHAKVINFGVLYGMSPRGLAVATGMDFYSAKKFIDQYFELRAPIRKYLDETLTKAKTDGYVETYFGRRRPTPDINSSNFIIRESAKRAALNMPIQGTEADLMKRAMIEVDNRIQGIGEQILQIHDSILIECPSQNAEKVADILKDTMESIAPELGIKLTVEVSIGKNWGEL